MVRAPPCHGGSCGFEPRLPRILSALLLFIFIFVSCSKSDLSDFRKEGQVVTRELIAELKLIRSRDDLPVHAQHLQELFDRLVDIMIRAQQYKIDHPETAFSSNEAEELPDSDTLRSELNRILHMEGGAEVIEKAQEGALNRLDTFEQKKG